MRSVYLRLGGTLLFLVSCTGGDPGGVHDADPSRTGPPPVPARTVADADPKPWPDKAAGVEAVPAEAFTGGERAFTEVKEALLKSYYAEGLTEDDLYRAAARGMLEHADPQMGKWNKLLAPADLAELDADLKGEVVGIGARIEFDSGSGHAEVKGTISGSAAEKAGLVAGDTIVSVDGKLYKGLREHDLVADIRGKAGETVTLTVLRGDKLQQVPIRREVVAFDAVSDFIVGRTTGYVGVRSFSEKTAPLVRSALEDVARQGARAVVLDLRGNQGGSFEAAVASAELFLPAGTGIVTVRTREEKPDARISKGTPILASVPLAVLVDGMTSSGAELVTGALQEGRRAVVVGEHTYGKWSVQMIDKLSNGYAFKYTMGLFQTPAGRSFQGTGLTPDVEVDMPGADVEKAQAITDPVKRLAADPQLRSACGLLGAQP
jgi:carboxyl-terminal processing protease